MAEEPHILLTNDDGIEAPGLEALRNRLERVGTVDVVAPRENQSAVGRSLTYGRTDGSGSLDLRVEDGEFSCPVPHESHARGYAVAGTPCDCVIVGTSALERSPDLVVAGCNPGANVGAYVLSRSGTVSAAMEAAMLGTPAIAVSMDVIGYPEPYTVGDFEDAASVTATLARESLENGVFDSVDYLNVNVPHPERPLESVEITHPTTVYEMDASYEDGEFRLYNRLWEQMAAGSLPDDPGSDRRALLSGAVSVSPLRPPVEPALEGAVEGLAEDLSV